MIAPKGIKAEAEIAAAQQAIDLLGGRLIEVREVDVPGLKETRRLVVIEKVAPTPARYPRRAGVPAKYPLSQT